MRPLDWVILKVAQVCNINCTYCYVYNRGDTSWATRPLFIEPSTVTTLVRRINEHCEKHSLQRFTIELHGGEPLMLGKRRFESLLATLRADVRSTVSLQLVMQTNGLLLDHEWLQLFEKYDLTFGISLDGPVTPEMDQRLSKQGAPQSERILQTIEGLREQHPEYRNSFSGALCVVNPALDGASVTRWFWNHGFHSVDYLLPDGNWTNLPDPWHGAEAYGAFLIDAFNEWILIDDPSFRIRSFEVVSMALMGVVPRLDSFGGDLSTICVVESNGAISFLDTLRICGGVFAKDDANIATVSFDEFRALADISTMSTPGLECQSCEKFAGCRGGYMPHRYDGHDFSKPSIYCSALKSLVGHIESVLVRELRTPNA